MLASVLGIAGGLVWFIARTVRRAEAAEDKALTQDSAV